MECRLIFEVFESIAKIKKGLLILLLKSGVKGKSRLLFTYFFILIYFIQQFILACSKKFRIIHYLIILMKSYIIFHFFSVIFV